MSPLKGLVSPIPTALTILRHLLSAPPSLAEVPLSQPVLQRLQWIRPDPDSESFLYFNNMSGHGASGRAEKLRIALTLLGPSAWEICAPEQVEYKVDDILQADGLPEVFSRVTVWETKHNGAPTSNEDKLAIILKLEREESSCLVDDPESLVWKYFDLQDLVTPGLDTRPWFRSVGLAAAASKRSRQGSNGAAQERPLGDPESTSQTDGNDYWGGYSSGSVSPSPPPHGRSISLDPDLQARLRNTPLYRRKAPSVASASDEHHDNRPVSATPQLHHGPTDLLSRISRTPLYKRAPSVASSAEPTTQPAENISITELLEAAGIVNLSSPLQQAAVRAIKHSSTAAPQMRLDASSSVNLDDVKRKLSAGFVEAPPALFSDLQPQPQSLRPSTATSVEELLMNSLRASYQLYRHSLSLDQNQIHKTGVLEPGELFVALAHRVVREDDQQCSLRM